MAEEQDLIAHYIDKPGIDEDTKYLLARLKQVSDAFDNLNTKKISLSGVKGTNATIQGVQETTAAQEKLKKSTDELNLSIREYKKITDQVATNRAKISVLESNSAKDLERERLALQRRNAELKNQAREENSVKGSLEQRRAALIRLYAVYDNQSPVERASAAGQRLQKITAGLTLQVKELENESGRAQRNVGNYPLAEKGTNAFVGALSKAFSLLKYITYILPGIGIAGALGFIAEPVINFTTKLFGASEASKKLQESLKKQKEALISLIDSFRNYGAIKDEALGGASAEISTVQTLAGVVLNQANSYKERNAALQELGRINKNYFGDLTLEKNSLKTLTGLVNEYVDALVNQAIIKEVESDIGKIGAAYFRQIREIDLAKKALKDYKAELEKANEDFTQRNNQNNIRSFAIGTKEEAFRLAALTQEVIKQEDALKPLDAQYNTLKRSLNDLNIEAFKFRSLQDSGKGKNKTANDADFTNTEFAANEKLLKANAERIKQQLNQDAKYQQTIIDNETKSISVRLQALDDYNEDKIALIKIERDIELAGISEKLKKIESVEQKSLDARNNEEKKLLIQKESLIADKAAIEATFSAKELDIIREGTDKKVEIIKQGLSMEDKARMKLLDKRLEDIDIAEQNELDALKESFDKKLITVTEFETKRNAIHQRYELVRLIQSTQNAKDLLIAALQNEKDTAGLEQKLADASLKLDDYVTEKKIANQKKLQEARDTFLKDTEADFSQFVSFSYDNEKNKIQDQIDTLEKKKQKDIEIANQTILNEQDKAAAITVIEARSAAQREQLENKKRDANIKQAQVEKAIGILKIGVDTAQSVSKLAAAAALARAEALLLLANPLTAAYAPIAFASAAAISAQIPLTIASGAIQAGLVLAKPIPRYKHGTPKEGHQGGLAVVGDGGRKEFVLLPTGEGFITPDKTTMVDLPKNTQVFSDPHRLSEMIFHSAMKPINPMPQGSQSADSSAAIIKELRHVGSMIATKRENHWYWKDGQMKNIVKRGSDQTEYINKNIFN